MLQIFKFCHQKVAARGLEPAVQARTGGVGPDDTIESVDNSVTRMQCAISVFIRFRSCDSRFGMCDLTWWNRSTVFAACEKCPGLEVYWGYN